MDHEPMTQPPISDPEPVAPPLTAIPRQRGSGQRLLNVLLAGALVLAVGGVAFAAGRLTAPPATGLVNGNFPNGQPGGPVLNGNPRGGTDGNGGVLGFQGGPTIEGTVESITDTTLTLKLADGQTIQIALDASTTYHAQTDASPDDVATGGKVLVRVNARAANGGGNVSGPSASDVTVVP